jgi:hypothetical protein
VVHACGCATLAWDFEVQSGACKGAGCRWSHRTTTAGAVCPDLNGGARGGWRGTVSTRAAHRLALKRSFPRRSACATRGTVSKPFCLVFLLCPSLCLSLCLPVSLSPYPSLSLTRRGPANQQLVAQRRHSPRQRCEPHRQLLRPQSGIMCPAPKHSARTHTRDRARLQKGGFEKTRTERKRSGNSAREPSAAPAGDATW